MTGTIYELCLSPLCTKEALLAAVAQADEEDRDPNEVAFAIGCSDRLDLLEQLKDDPVYGEEAAKELARKQWMNDEKKKFEDRVANYPTILKEWHQLLKSSKLLGIFDVVYPSVQAQINGWGDNYVAISGDGLLDFLFEVLSFEGKRGGRFRLVRRALTPPATI